MPLVIIAALLLSVISVGRNGQSVPETASALSSVQVIAAILAGAGLWVSLRRKVRAVPADRFALLGALVYLVVMMNLSSGIVSPIAIYATALPLSFYVAWLVTRAQGANADGTE